METKFVFLGTGCSNALPNLRHVIQKEANCSVCESAVRDMDSKNRRGTPSLWVQTPNDEEGLLVDCGKSFYDSVCRVLSQKAHEETKFRISSVLLTHDHMDAVGGFDNLREVQLTNQPINDWTIQSPTPIYCTDETFSYLRKVYGYMFRDEGCGRVVGNLIHKTIPCSISRITIDNIPIHLLPVLHGGSYVSLGFAFGENGSFCYLSDVNNIPTETMDYLKTLSIKVLVIDALRIEVKNYSHFSLKESLQIIKELNPTRALITGMCCEMDHETVNESLRGHDPPTELAFDGMEINISI
eukprot:TRINITY_DN20591_c0_g1_i1.p1 TRINITY_DN20591_c0_g1~~TRINITY_DN20591_c0_g1_i1.p1  ORF type:complete len:298 (+),score=55.01 TRINITY_DN20591_c0_g1_i1:57-950(+)